MPGLDWFGSPLFRNLSILWNSDLLAFPTHHGGGLWRPSEQAYTEMLESYEPHVQLDWNRRYGLLGSVDLSTETRVQRFFEFREDGTFRLIRSVPVIEDWYFVAAVDTKGKLATQDHNSVVLTSLDGSTQYIKVPIHIGGVQSYSPDGQYLLFSSRKHRQASIFDLASQEVVANIQWREDESLREVQFQDSAHVIMLMNSITAEGKYDKSVNDHLKRWDWKSGDVQTLNAGTFDDAETMFWMRLVWASFAIWLLALIRNGFAVRDRISSSLVSCRPWLELALANLFVLTLTARRVWVGADCQGIHLTIALASIPALLLSPLFTVALCTFLVSWLMLFRLHGYHLRTFTQTQHQSG